MSDEAPAAAKASTWTGIQRKVILGLLTILPLAVVWFVLSFLVDFLSWLGRPLVDAVFRHSGLTRPEDGSWLNDETVLTAIAVIVALWIIYIVGAVASNVIGARLIKWLGSLLDRIPLVRQVYGAVQKLVQSLSHKPDGVQRVVLLPFPTPEMRAIGFVTKTFTDAASGQELAAVYMPTAVNPTCGYLEIIPIDKCVETDLTADQAMNMILSGGATAPDEVRFSRPI
ncbi:MAG: DUF502 domain-containing protein [Alphaproteobacteria bacterium]|nr:DUF502 domain-containing protein [Alphaproteobacteria bacterium]